MEKNAFFEFVGDTPTNRLLDLLITWKDFDYSLTDLSKKAGVSWSTLHRVFPRLVSNKIVISTRTVGRAKLYRLNESNPVVKRFIGVYDEILAQELRKVEEKQLVKVKAR